MAINLLPQNLQKVQKHRNYRLISVSISLILLIGLVAATAGVFSYRFMVSNEYNDLKNQVNDLTSQINSKQSTEWYLTSVSDKTTTISNFLDSQKPLGDVIAELDQRTGDEIDINSVTIGSDGSINMDGNTTLLPELATYLKILDSEKSVFTELSLDELRFNDKEFIYNFSLSLNYTGNPVNQSTDEPDQESNNTE